ncbi:MAG: maleylpyruvate isomerase family mycothiol-dependent enzyme [Actinomycetota bacterium]
MTDVADPSDQDVLMLLEQAFSAVDEVCSLLDDAEWDRPTECPGWTVKDNLAHIADYESRAIGRPGDDSVDVSGLPHIVNEVGALNERGIQARRGTPGPEVLAEYREVTTERLKQLGDPALLDVTTQTPFGESATRRFLPIRVVDVFYHEQDIRRATGRRGHLDGAVAAFVAARMALLMPRVVAKNAQAPDGSVVVFEVSPPGRTFAVRTEGGRGAMTDPVEEPTVGLRFDGESFLRVVGGRVTPDAALADGTLAIDGDRDLAGRILQNIVVMI